MIPQITQVTYLTDYQLRLQFNDGTVREVDLYNKLFGEEFKPLKNLDFFRQVRLNPETHTIEWPNGAYFSPGYLHEIGREVKETAYSQAKLTSPAEPSQPSAAAGPRSSPKSQ